MSWAAKRFWKQATVIEMDGGFAILLDQRQVKTPGRNLLLVPTEGMARAIAAEWDAQHGPIRPETMPYTRAANSALEKVAPQFDEVVGLLAAYGESDLLCYRAPGPQELTALQSQAWDPLLHWAAETLNAPLTVTTGVVHIPQPDLTIKRLHALTAAHSHFQIAAFHDLVSLSGSLILAFAVTHGHLSSDQAWALSRIDETYQISLWGEDDEAAALTETKRQAFHQAARFWAVC